MKRQLGMGAVLLLVGTNGVFAQGNKPAAAPAAKAPAAKSSPGAMPANAPAANAPAANAPAAATAPPAAKTISVRVPSGGDYSAYIQEAPGAAPRQVTDKVDLEAPSLPRYTVYVLDMKSGYAARKSVDAKSPPAEISFASPDFNLVQKVRVLATGKEGKPIAQGTVTLTDSGNNTTRGIIQPASQGVAEFSFVKNGSGTIAVAAGQGAESTTVSKTVSIDLPKNETAQSVTVELPSVTQVVEPPAGSAAAPANAPAAATNAPAAAPPAAAPPATAPPPAAPAPAAAPVQATPIERAQPSLTDTIGNFVVGLIQFAILIALLVFGYRYAKKQGITVETVLKKMGVQPETVGAGGASLAGANLSGSVAAPGPAPGPPPVVADPNQCQFCGQMKDPSGGCACTVTRGAGGAAPVGGFGGAAAASGSGPRLVAMGGTYLGQVFPIQGVAVIGRDASNPVPLDRDTTASRRHAQITDQGGIYQIQDLGSSNGTFVNGARITETQLSPGDEVAIGGTRFRFEV